jgi:hypothetical protein
MTAASASLGLEAEDPLTVARLARGRAAILAYLLALVEN